MKNRWVWAVAAVVVIAGIILLIWPKNKPLSSGLESLAPSGRFAILVGISDGSPWADKDIRLMSSLIGVRAGERNALVSSDSAECTKQNIIGKISEFAGLARKGDIVYLYFSCHGGQIFDVSGDEHKYDPKDDQDEVMLLYNKEQLVDDEIDSLLKLFKTGVQIIMVADCCHSGSVFGYRKPSKFDLAPNADPSGIQAELIYIGACQDDFLAKTDNNEVSRFTREVAKFGMGNSSLTYFGLFGKVKHGLRNRQVPAYAELSSKGICREAGGACLYIQESFRNQVAFSK